MVALQLYRLQRLVGNIVKKQIGGAGEGKQPLFLLAEPGCLDYHGLLLCLGLLRWLRILLAARQRKQTGCAAEKGNKLT